MWKALDRLADLLGVIASVVARLMLACVAVLLFVQVVLRYGFGAALPWPEEAARYLMIWVVMLAGGLLVKDNQLVRVDFFDAYWPSRLLAIRNVVFRVMLAVLLGLLLWKGYENAIFGLRRGAATLPISFFWIYLAIPVGAGLMMVHMLILALKDLIHGPEETGPSVLNSDI
jgi:C4-dicarboxylate transporter DctQ subunit